MVGLPCVMNQCGKLHIAGWKWTVFTRVCLEPVYVACGDFHSGSEKGTACVQQILCQSWDKWYEDTMIQQAFRDQCLSRAEMFQ